MLSYPKVLKESIIETGLDRHQELTLELCRRKVMQKLLQNQHADKTEWKDEKYGVPHYARIYSTSFQETARLQFWRQQLNSATKDFDGLLSI